MATTALAIRPKTPIPAALALVDLTPADFAVLPAQRTELAMQLRRLQRYRKRAETEFLPIERTNALPRMDADIHELTMRAAGYHRFPTKELREVLRWRNADGWPTLAPFSISLPKCEFTACDQRYMPRGWSGRRLISGLPESLHACYDDVFTTIEKLAAQRGRDLTLGVAFAGTLPPDIRARIIEARARLTCITILAEATEWQLAEVPRPAIDTDPIVLGFTQSGECWIIAAFDLTPVEELIRDIAEGKRPPRG